MLQVLVLKNWLVMLVSYGNFLLHGGEGGQAHVHDNLDYADIACHWSQKVFQSAFSELYIMKLI